MSSEILFFTQDPESPCSKAIRLREGIDVLAPVADVSGMVDGVKAAIVDADGENRQMLVKALLKEKLPFALCGLAGETPESLKRLCAAAKRRHIQVCWLGSWRFQWAMARLKEIISSGALGTMQQLKLVKPEADGIFERLRDDDLLKWLSAGNESAVAYEDSLDNNFKVIAVGSRGTATSTIRPDGVNEFAVALDDQRPRSQSAPAKAWEAEVGCLLLAISNNAPWTMMGKIPN